MGNIDRYTQGKRDETYSQNLVMDNIDRYTQSNRDATQPVYLWTIKTNIHKVIVMQLTAKI